MYLCCLLLSKIEYTECRLETFKIFQSRYVYVRFWPLAALHFIVIADN